MSRDSQKNEFLGPLYDLYDYIKFPEKQHKEIVIQKTGFLGLRKEKIEKDIGLEVVMEKVVNLRSSLLSSPPSFDRLWDFCEFIRVAEKIFFYNNDPNNELYVEADIGNSGSGTRKFRIKNYNSEIRFTLEKDVFGIDSITIHVVRNYGLKMENKYTIANTNIDYKDSSDLYLINEINFKLMGIMSERLSEIVDYIMEGERGNE